MQIKTIDDFKKADRDSILNMCEKITIVNDIVNFKHWLESNEQSIDIPFNISSKRKLCVHPSSVCKSNVCPLKIYYECTGKLTKNKQHSLELHNTFDTGSAIHALLQAYCENIYNSEDLIQFEKEVTLSYPELHMYGHCDGKFTFSDHRFILEIKTIKEGGNSGWEKVQTKPLPDNERQLRLYMQLSDIPFGLVYYWCKNTGAIKEHVITYDGGKVWNEVVEFLKPIVAAAYNNGPEIKGMVGNGCYFCDFYHGCPAYRSKYENPKRAFRS